MGWVVALVAITALVMLGFILSRPEVEKDWRDQTECDSDSHAMASRMLHMKMIAMRVMLTTD
jgi:hypothetical protein